MSRKFSSLKKQILAKFAKFAKLQIYAEMTFAGSRVPMLFRVTSLPISDYALFLIIVRISNNYLLVKMPSLAKRSVQQIYLGILLDSCKANWVSGITTSFLR